MATTESVQRFGRKKTAVVVTQCKKVDRQKFSGVDMRFRVRGGGHTSQIYATRQSIAKAVKEIKDIHVRDDRTPLVADPKRCEPKKFGWSWCSCRSSLCQRKKGGENH
ncbi:hypothetical protein MKW98_014003 [Papaver atlanticum]|uniref:Uncharacterized protein n=1 Tax=Papaver atlanticum TaxID=357466 RepID=A0AAD4SIF7_9MAGN|nr:hypothetical protein MKW98_014003 [Papaver atlanticum]